MESTMLADVAGPLFDLPMRIVSNHGDELWVTTLDRQTALMHVESLVALHALIPLVHWTREDLLSDKIGNRPFRHKWLLSLLITRSPADPVGFLVSYLRPADDNFHAPSVYMHRMAIAVPLQQRGIGRRVIESYLGRVFEKTTIDHVTLQTNDTPENASILALYESLGFMRVKRVFYPEKTDWVMARSRTPLSPDATG